MLCVITPIVGYAGQAVKAVAISEHNQPFGDTKVQTIATGAFGAENVRLVTGSEIERVEKLLRDRLTRIEDLRGVARERDAARKVRDHAIANCQTAIEQRDTARKEAGAIDQTLDNAMSRIRRLECDTAREEERRALKERNQYAVQVGALKAQLEIKTAQLKTVVSDRSRLTNLLERLIPEQSIRWGLINGTLAVQAELRITQTIPVAAVCNPPNKIA